MHAIAYAMEFLALDDGEGDFLDLRTIKKSKRDCQICGTTFLVRGPAKYCPPCRHDRRMFNVQNRKRVVKCNHCQYVFKGLTHPGVWCPDCHTNRHTGVVNKRRSLEAQKRRERRNRSKK